MSVSLNKKSRTLILTTMINYSSAVRAKRVTADYSWQYSAKAELPYYEPDPDTGPSTMELLLLVLWPDLTELYETLSKSAFDGEPFAEIYWELFEILGDEKTKSAIRTLEDLINELKERIS